MAFDELIRADADAHALRYLASDLYKSGEMGGIRKALLDRAADRLTAKPLEDRNKCRKATSRCGVCPSCKNLLERYLTGETRRLDETGEATECLGYEMEFCLYCGQRLKWEED
jgi:hypothetical protein